MSNFTVNGLTPATDTGVKGDSITSISAPSFTGTAVTPNDIIEIIDNTSGNFLGYTYADGSGNWTINDSSPLQEGSNNLSFLDYQYNQNNGYTLVGNASQNVTLDTIAPAAPVVPSITAATDSGTIGDGVTNNNKPTLTGTAEANSLVTVMDGGMKLAAVTADGSGNWSYTPSSALTEGVHNITANASDAAGNVGSVSPTFSLTVDTTAPLPPVSGGITAATDSGVVGDGVTNNNKPVFTGTAEANSIVNVYDGLSLVGTTTADNSGNWTYTPTTALTDSTHNFVETSTDQAGNVSFASSNYALTVDTTAPVAPTVNGITVATDSGTVGDDVTNNTTPTIVGMAEANSTVSVYTKANQLLGQTVADQSGNWSYKVAQALTDGAYQITTTSTDVAGNVSAVSSPLNLVIDTTAPLSSQASLSANSDTGVLGDGITNNKMPMLMGTAEANSAVNISLSANGNVVATGMVMADLNGNWSYAPSAQLQDGVYQVTTSVSDVAGNTSPVSNAFQLVVDSQSSAATQITSQVQASGDNVLAGSVITFTIATDKPVIVNTSSGTPTLTLNDGNQAVYQGSPDGTHLTFTANVSQGESTNNLTVTGVNLNGGTITDQAGNNTSLINVATAPGAATGVTVGDPVVSGGSGPIFRFFNTGDGSHFYTVSSTEKAQVQSSRPDLVYEGTAFRSVGHDDPNAASVYRFFDQKDGSHFFTTNSGERDSLIQSRSDLTYEGTSFYEHATQQAGDVAVYRFFNNQNGTHLFTSDAGEKASVSSLPSYNYEGIAFYTHS